MEPRNNGAEWLAVGAILAMAMFLGLLVMVGESRNSWPDTPPNEVIGVNDTGPQRVPVAPETPR